MASAQDSTQHSEQMHQWLTAAHQGSRNALGELLEMCRHYLLMVANRQLPADLHGKVGASDLVQDTFLRAKEHFARFDGHSEEELLAWLSRILQNHLANVRRSFHTERRQVQREVTGDSAALKHLRSGLVDHAETPSAQAEAAEQTESLNRALQQLPESYRQVVFWRNWERRSFEDIGQLLGRSAEAARKLWARAIEQLQQLLEAAP